MITHMKMKFAYNKREKKQNQLKPQLNLQPQKYLFYQKISINKIGEKIIKTKRRIIIKVARTRLAIGNFQSWKRKGRS